MSRPSTRSLLLMDHLQFERDGELQRQIYEISDSIMIACSAAGAMAIDIQQDDLQQQSSRSGHGASVADDIDILDLSFMEAGSNVPISYWLFPRCCRELASHYNLVKTVIPNLYEAATAEGNIYNLSSFSAIRSAMVHLRDVMKVGLDDVMSFFAPDRDDHLGMRTMNTMAPGVVDPSASSQKISTDMDAEESYDELKILAWLRKVLQRGLSAGILEIHLHDFLLALCAVEEAFRNMLQKENGANLNAVLSALQQRPLLMSSMAMAEQEQQQQSRGFMNMLQESMRSLEKAWTGDLRSISELLRRIIAEESYASCGGDSTLTEGESFVLSLAFLLNEKVNMETSVNGHQPRNSNQLNEAVDNGHQLQHRNWNLLSSPAVASSSSSSSSTPMSAAAIATMVPADRAHHLHHDHTIISPHLFRDFQEITILDTIYGFQDIEGNGTFVYKVRWWHPAVSEQPVFAMKVYSSSSRTEMRTHFVKEAGIHLRLHHPNVVQSICAFRDGDGDRIRSSSGGIGRSRSVTSSSSARSSARSRRRTEMAMPMSPAAATSSVRFGILMELMSMNLRQLVQGHFSRLSMKQKVSIMLQIAKGMEYIHAKGVVHRDLKPENILVKVSTASSSSHGGGAPARSNGDGRAGDEGQSLDRIHIKISDFDVAKIKQMSSRFRTPLVGTRFYRAPELLHENDEGGNRSRNKVAYHTKSADVYSYAMLCYDLLTGTEPFGGLGRTTASLHQLIRKGGRPEFPPTRVVQIPPCLKHLMSMCWHGDPDKRPTFTQICGTLRYVYVYLVSWNMSTTPTAMLRHYNHHLWADLRTQKRWQKAVNKNIQRIENHLQQQSQSNGNVTLTITNRLSGAYKVGWLPFELSIMRKTKPDPSLWMSSVPVTKITPSWLGHNSRRRS